ncbi:MAG: alpha/beta fold hydrolase [Rhizobacter sp.]|nr:alpha/beta fold hydrolase [Rhizobacter sp.]
MTRDEADSFIARLEASGERRLVDWHGIGIAWRRFGSGPPLVLLHGGHGSWLHWVRNIEALAREHTLWVPDMPGFGDSASLPEGAGLQDQVDALIATLDEVIGTDAPFDLAGFSFGGLVASTLASQHRRVRRLALLGCAGHGGTRRQTTALLNWRSSANEAELESTMRHNLAAHMLSGPLGIDGLALAVHIRSCRATRFRSKEISRAGKLPQVLAAVAAPTLLAWGANDVTVQPEAMLRSLTAGHPHRRGRVVEGGGHWVQFECAPAINPLLSDWFGRGPGGQQDGCRLPR